MMSTKHTRLQCNQGLLGRLQFFASEFPAIDKQAKSLLTAIIKAASSGPLDSKQSRNIFNIIKQTLLTQKTEESAVKLLRIFDKCVPLIIQDLLEDLKSPKSSIEQEKVDILLSLVLQYTDRATFSILKHYTQLHLSPFNTKFSHPSTQLKCLFRFFEAQPYLLKVWDCSPLFTVNLETANLEKEHKFLILILRQMCRPSQTQKDLIEQTKSLSLLEFIDSLRINKAEESKKQEYFDKMFEGEIEMVCERNFENRQHEGEGKVRTPYLEKHLDEAVEVIQRNVFQHFAVYGEEGSGKMSFIQILGALFNQKGQRDNQNNLIVITIDETFDSKNLVGTYVCNEIGEFVFKKGPLTVAAEQGMWLILRNVEKAPPDLLSFLLPLVQENEIQVSSKFKITPKLGFRMIVMSTLASSSKSGGQDPIAGHIKQEIKPFLDALHPIWLERLDTREDFNEILKGRFQYVFAIDFIPPLLFESIEFLKGKLNYLKTYMLDSKAFSIRQLFKVVNRINEFLKSNISSDEFNSIKLGQVQSIYVSSHWRQIMIQEISDIYLSFIYDKEIRLKLIQDLVSSVWNKDEYTKNQGSQLDPLVVAEFIISQSREWGVNQQNCFFGRSKPLQINQHSLQSKESENQESKTINQAQSFVFTATTLRLMEQISQSVNNKEPLLLVGETGTGKTTAVQEMAKLLGKKLHVFNMSQNTDSSDLLGGFKPVDVKYIIRPLYEQFLEVFKSLYSIEKNQKFLDIMQNCYTENKMKDFLKCVKHGIQYITQKETELKNKKESSAKIEEIKQARLVIEKMVEEAHYRLQKMESSMGGSGFIFQFIEGTLIKSIQNGDWILLDEINLANDALLNRLSTLIDGEHILLNERGDLITTQMHKDFRLFFCMNPPYTSAAKKQLPWEIRQRVTEVYVDELERESDIMMIIDKKVGNALKENNNPRKILQFYLAIRGNSEGSLQISNPGKKKNHIGGLRNLSRAIFFMNSAIDLNYPASKAIFDGLATCFTSHLEKDLRLQVQQLIMELFQIKKLPKMQMTSHHESHAFNSQYAYISDFIIRKGNYPPQSFDPKDFVLTESFKHLLKQVASVVAVTNYAVILEGPTSVGKTSTVQYLAAITNNKVIRINNHMHTDIQEYIGQYVPDKKEGQGSGKLVFQEGVLVEAVRNGYWVILDELNLAPSEVLEALNRLLDDNRELHIVETQLVVKAHPNFRIFATQNPTQGYGGRKELSEAFKNRFIMIQVSEVPLEELVEILIQKSEIPKSRAELMVRIMEQLQIFRGGKGNIFAGKDANITVRDLLKWAQRLRSQQEQTIEAVAMEGFLVLGERARFESDKQFIKETIEKVARVKLNEKEYYKQYFTKHITSQLKQFSESHAAKENIPELIMSQQLQRLAVLMHKCLSNSEPVLLVGETGCGKTTLCQVFASIINKQDLFSINCHQNTETSDFIGCMRTKTNFMQQQNEFIELHSQIMTVLKQLTGYSEDSVMLDSESGISKKKINSMYAKLKELEQTYKQEVKECLEFKQLLEKLKHVKIDLNCIFEWHDGILIESMQKGGLLLIDEISLANDSVLERLNSVFEAGRILILSEKSSSEAIIIKAHNLFNIVATMNPSGDFGKKELSPALRNRMTEIWVESYFQQEELRSIPVIVQSALHLKEENSFLIKEVKDSVDIYKIIFETASKHLKGQISQDQAQKLAMAIFNVICFVNFRLGAKYYAMQRKSLSIRDILNIIQFIQVTLSKLFNKNIALAFYHAVQLVIIDGVCLGVEMIEDKMKKQIVSESSAHLDFIITELLLPQKQSLPSSFAQLQFLNTSSALGVQPFLINKLHSQHLKTNQTYAFDAPTTQSNLMKLLRAYQLNKPILIEGPPGVGKTSIIESLARASGRKLIRVNLSEQTDMMDLLGSEYPVFRKEEGEKSEEDDIQFHWCDGVLLQAIKEGHWFLIDEMNLAQQSILEGLNAILDHRRTVYIPELNKEFKCHEDFFLFACQNPSQSSTSGGGRKTLPKSFLNRFNKIYLEELGQEDYKIIIQRQVESDSALAEIEVEKLLKVSKQIELILKKENHIHPDEGVINMRDLSRFLKLYKLFKAELNSHDSALTHAFQILYLSRITKHKQLAIRKFLKSEMIKSSLDIKFEELPIVRINDAEDISFSNCQKATIIKSNDHIDNSHLYYSLHLQEVIDLKGEHSLDLQYLSDCLNANIPILVLTNDSKRLVANIQTLAKVSHNTLNRILLNEKSDTSQLLGCFEQTSESDSSDQKSAGHSRFEWVDSVLLKAILEGEWVLFENANLCNPSIMDRINPLLEEGNTSLSINEQGLIEGDSIREVKSHAHFRSIFLINTHTYQDQGKDVSRALRNRCVQINVIYKTTTQTENSICDKEQDLITQLQVRIQNSSVQERALDYKFHFNKWETQVISEYQTRSLSPSKSKEASIQQIDSKLSTISLGKRKFNPEQVAISSLPLKELISESLAVLQELNFQQDSENQSAQTMKHFQASYMFQLVPFMETSSDLKQYMQHKFHESDLFQFICGSQEKKGHWLEYLRFRVQRYISDIKVLFSAHKDQIMNKQTKNYINSVASISTQNLMNIDDAVIFFGLVKKIVKHNQLSQLNSSLYQIYLLSKVIANSSSEVQEKLKLDAQGVFQQQGKDQLVHIIMESRDSHKLQEQQDQIFRIGPNKVSNAEILVVKQEMKRLEELKLSPLKNIFIINLASKMQKNTKSISLTGKQGLSDNFFIIQMNENKQVQKESQVDDYSLIENIESPYQLIIPQSSLIILASQVNTYPFLCLLKDLKTIYSNKLITKSGKRQTGLPLLQSVFQLKDSVSTLLTKFIGVSNIESSYSMEIYRFSQYFLNAVLDSDRLTPMKYIQAQYLCEQKLSKVISYFSDSAQQGKPDSVDLLSKSRIMSKEQQDNARTAIQQLKECAASNRSVNSSLESIKEEIILSPYSSELNKLVEQIFEQASIISQMDVNSILETLLIVPLELARKDEFIKLQNIEYNSKFLFQFYHMRDKERAHSQLLALQDSTSSIIKEKTQMEKLKPSTEEGQKLLESLILFFRELESALGVEYTANGKNLDKFFIDLARDMKNKKSQFKMVIQKTEIVNRMLFQGMQKFLLHYNHVVAEYLLAIAHLTAAVQMFSRLMAVHQPVNSLRRNVFNFENQPSSLYLFDQLYQTQRLLKQEGSSNPLIQNLYEQQLKFVAQERSLAQDSKATCIDEFTSQSAKISLKSTILTHTLDYFIRRQITKKLLEEQQFDDQEAQVLNLPFKMKVQSIMENNKAMDEKTKKDKAEEEKEAQLQIEANFPSYFDEYQKLMFAGGENKRSERENEDIKEVSVWEVLREVLNIKKAIDSGNTYEEIYKKQNLIKTRLRIVALLMKLENANNQIGESFSESLIIEAGRQTDRFSWMRDVKCFIDEKVNIERQIQTGVMSITDVKLDPTYNFYHDPLPQEARLVYTPLIKLIQTVRVIAYFHLVQDIIQEWESPILSDLLFISNYMLTNFILSEAPLMKILTGLELILNKVDEWEVYASKSVGNSLEGIEEGNILNQLKQLVIRYRKIQIMSWRNLLQWKKQKMIKEDVDESYIRLLHTIERQVFDENLYKLTKVDKLAKKTNRIEKEIFELMDLYIRESSLGQFQARLQFIKLVRKVLKVKLQVILLNNQQVMREPKSVKHYQLLNIKKKITQQVEDRLVKVINILTYIFEYYSQFETKLKETIKRLDEDAVHTLIDVQKWTLQKFTVIKSNVEKVHRQLNKACNKEEEILMQNVASLILTSSRKKYIKQDSQLIELDKDVHSLGSTDDKHHLSELEPFKINELSSLVVSQLSNVKISSHSLIKQLSHLERTLIPSLYPETQHYEQSLIPTIFERITSARNTNKKHIQRKAFSDMLKYLKDQGLGIGKDDTAQLEEMIINSEFVQRHGMSDSKVVNRVEVMKLYNYYLKGQEVLMMLESTGQVDENSDLRNADINRARSLCQSLMKMIISIGANVAFFLKAIKSMESMPFKLQKKDSSEAGSASDNLLVSQQKARKYKQVVSKLNTVYENAFDKLSILDKLEGTEYFRALQLDESVLKMSPFLSKNSLEQLTSGIKLIKNQLDFIIQAATKSKNSRASSIALTSKDEVEAIEQEILLGILSPSEEDSMQTESPALTISKKCKLLEGKVKLFYQSFVSILQQQRCSEEYETLRKDSNNTATHNTALTFEENLNIEGSHHGEESENLFENELTIKEQLEFTDTLREELFKEKLSEIVELSSQISNLRGVVTEVEDSAVRGLIEGAETMLQKVRNVCRYIGESQFFYLKSICKFNYVVLRIFIYLAYEGFCGKEEDEKQSKEQQQEDDKYFGGEGCGMGDGEGQDNVSNEIQHEEQLEGLKKYESEDEQEKKPDDQKKDKEENKEDNDFEMNEDFEGDLEDQKPNEGEEEKKNDEKDNIDDQLDKVDEMLDNQLWNQNMQDMEEEEEKNNEKKDEKNEEVDLGERKLDEMNQMKQQEKEVAAGDRDKQDDAGDQEHEEQENQQEDLDKDMPDNEDNQQNDIHLDREDNVKQDEQQKKDEAVDEKEDEKEGEGEEEKGQDEEGSVEGDADEEDKAMEGEEEEDGKSKGEEDEQMSIDQDKQGDGEELGEEEQDENNQNEEMEDQYQKDFNKDVLDDDKIEEQNQQQDSEQANFKQKKSEQQNLNKQSKQDNKQNKGEQQQQNLESEFDVNGNDILYQLTQMLNQKKKDESKPQQQKQQPMPKDDKLKQVENPQMNQEKQENNEQQTKQDNKKHEEDEMAMEYELNEKQDDEAEQLQGRLATNKIEENTLQMKNMEDENQDMEKQNESEDFEDSESEDGNNLNMEETKQSIKQNAQMAQKKAGKEQEEEKKQRVEQVEDEQAMQEDLINKYEQYLANKKENTQDFDAAEAEDQEPEKDMQSYFHQITANNFDYNQSKLHLRNQYSLWLQDSSSKDVQNDLLNKFKQTTSTASASLCEQLRIVLEPQLTQQLQGDYKTGKRLNMKKVVGFIASNYRNDRIWLRRTQPSKRDYKILIAIDDSLSMKEHNLGIFSLESMVTILEALNRLEVGKIAVAGIRERMELFQSFEDGYSSERTKFILDQFRFDYCAPKSSDVAMANFVRDANQMIDFQNVSGDGNCKNYPFVLVISDGRFNKNNVRQYLREAKEKNFLYIFVILDSVKSEGKGGEQKSAGSKGDGSILSLKSAEKDSQSGQIKLVPYLKDFPFEYYCIIRDVQQLPFALGNILVQWFSMISNSNGR